MRNVLLSIALLGLTGSSGWAQDAATVAPDHYKVLFENDRVRVLDHRDKPGEKSPMHSHPDSILYVLAPFKRRVTLPDGTSVVREPKAGAVIWAPAQAHQAEKDRKSTRLNSSHLG